MVGVEEALRCCRSDGGVRGVAGVEEAFRVLQELKRRSGCCRSGRGVRGFARGVYAFLWLRKNWTSDQLRLCVT